MALIVLGVSIVDANVSTYNTVAASMFIFYDYALTLGEEVELIWRGRLSWMSILFGFIRYLTFFIRIVHFAFCTNVFGPVPASHPGCVIWRWFQVLSGHILFLAVEILLITRVFAYYGRNKTLLSCLLVLLTAEITTMVALVATTLPGARVIIDPLPLNVHASTCIGVSTPPGYSSLWIPPLIMQSILSVLVARKFIKTRMDTPNSNPPLLLVFVRDNAWAFVLIFAVSLWATLAYETTAHLGEIAITWNYSILGFCGTRLILNLRSAATKDAGNSPTDVQSEMKFTNNLSSTKSQGTASCAFDAFPVERMKG